MGTGIMEGPYAAIFATHDDYGSACYSKILDEEISRIWNTFFAAKAQPDAAEDAITFELEELW